MNELRELLPQQPLEEKSIPAIEINTYMRLWDRVSFISRERNGFSTQEFVPLRSWEFLEQQLCVAAGLLDLGVDKGESVAVFSPNSIRYAAAVYAILSIGAVFVPLYPTVTEEEAEELLRHSGSRVVFVGDVSQYQKVVSILDKIKSPIKWVIPTYRPDAPRGGVIAYEELVRRGKGSGRVPDVLSAVKGLSPGDIAALIYTPGTTGASKGALLSHGNFIAQRPVIDLFKLNERDVRLANLPFSHVFGLSADLFSSGATGSLLAIVRSLETEEMMEYIKEIRPTTICSVPRMYEKICITTLQGISHLRGLKRARYSRAVNVGREIYVRECGGRGVPFFLKIQRFLLAPVLAGIRKTLRMDRVRLLVSGGSPLPLEVSYFFGGIGRPVIEGYGLTETAPIINVNLPGANKPGTVGPPIEGVVERISDEGEILVKGPTVCGGYFRNPEEDELAFTPDGFFRTGDIGRFDDDGYLTITGRLKDLIITSSGKNIAPLNIEKRFENDPMISHFCVVGDRKKYLTALVVPNFPMLRKYARDHNIKYGSEEELVVHAEVVSFYKKRIGAVCDQMARYEQIKKFTLLPHEFSVQGGELSPTFKFRRLFVQEKYKEMIDRMYPSSDSIPEEM